MNRFQSSFRMARLIVLGTAVLIVVVLQLQAWKGMPTEHLTRDPNAIFDAPLYVGFLSQVGALLWAAAASLCLYTASLLASQASHSEERHFLCAAGLLTLLLGLDDVFLLHEQFFPFIGIPEKLAYLAYGSLTLYVLIRFRCLIFRTEYPVLAAALLFFAVSVSLDCLQPQGIDIFLYEDGAKLMGIMSWLAYFAHCAYAVGMNFLGLAGASLSNPASSEEGERVRGEPATCIVNRVGS